MSRYLAFASFSDGNQLTEPAPSFGAALVRAFWLRARFASWGSHYRVTVLGDGHDGEWSGLTEDETETLEAVGLL